jgi:hypothetical protein
LDFPGNSLLDRRQRKGKERQQNQQQEAADGVAGDAGSFSPGAFHGLGSIHFLHSACSPFC